MMEEDCLDCERDPIEALRRLFVEVVQKPRIARGQNPAQRPVFLKPHGVALGYFEPLEELDEHLRIGVLAQGRRTAWVRFSSDASPSQSDLLNNTLGVGIKLFAIEGAKLEGDGETQDFLLQNHDVFFVDTAKEMCKYIKAGLTGEGYAAWEAANPVTGAIVKDMQKPESSVLSTTYWSGLPYSFGDLNVKYKLVPELTGSTVLPDDANYLAADLARRLREDEARFSFYVQFQKDPQKMPLDRATVRWEESESEPVKVAMLTLPRQDIASPGQASYGENLAFNPWHSLPEHMPQGSIAEARRVVYSVSANVRRDANGVPAREPAQSRAGSELAPAEDNCIVSAAIFPPVGIARVGDSENKFFIGPEVADPPAQEPGFYRDYGALKRQAARFRIYGLNAEGKAVRELNAPDARIRWTVHLANKKAAWYQFQLAMDIPEAGDAPLPLLRNAAVADRTQLVIDPGERSISGKDVSGGPAHRFDTGTFMGKPVYLGELQTDKEGRLIVLGGRGYSASHNGTKASTFANNEGWHDDISDGPVTAEVIWNNRKLKVQPGWIVVAPPNYAPMRKSIRTMWDLMRDTAITAGQLPVPVRPSFDRDVRPIFERLSGLQWVNAGYAAAFGWHGPNNLSTPGMLARLSRNNRADRELRQTIANQFRVLTRDGSARQAWPWQYGDAMNSPPTTSPRENASLSNTQLKFLQQWAAGDFEEDYDPQREPVRCLSELSPAEQTDMLTRAAMEFCLADAFHPGCETGWLMRISSLYSAPFRIKCADSNSVEPQYGASLTWNEIADFAANGPLGAQYPGGLTRWMALPWQTDSASCQSGYQSQYDPYLPTFWPARVPNQVLTAENYGIVTDGNRPLGERLAAFANRARWIRPLGTTYSDQINNMVAHFGKMGIVEQRPGPKNDPHFPETMEVESVPTSGHHALTAQHRDAKSEETTDLEHTAKAKRFPYGLRNS
jgi:hypothetical protein